MRVRMIFVALALAVTAGLAVAVEGFGVAPGRIAGLAFACAVIFGIPIAVVITRTHCPACGRVFALRPTAEKRPGPGLSREVLTQCRHCGQTAWRRESRGE